MTESAVANLMSLAVLKQLTREASRNLSKEVLVAGRKRVNSGRSQSSGGNGGSKRRILDAPCSKRRSEIMHRIPSEEDEEMVPMRDDEFSDIAAPLRPVHEAFEGGDNNDVHNVPRIQNRDGRRNGYTRTRHIQVPDTGHDETPVSSVLTSTSVLTCLFTTFREHVISEVQSIREAHVKELQNLGNALQNLEGDIRDLRNVVKVTKQSKSGTASDM